WIRRGGTATTAKSRSRTRPSPRPRAVLYPLPAPHDRPPLRPARRPPVADIVADRSAQLGDHDVPAGLLGGLQLALIGHLGMNLGGLVIAHLDAVADPAGVAAGRPGPPPPPTAPTPGPSFPPPPPPRTPPTAPDPNPA